MYACWIKGRRIQPKDKVYSLIATRDMTMFKNISSKGNLTTQKLYDKEKLSSKSSFHPSEIMFIYIYNWKCFQYSHLRKYFKFIFIVSL